MNDVGTESVTYNLRTKVSSPTPHMAQGSQSRCMWEMFKHQRMINASLLAQVECIFRERGVKQNLLKY